MEGVTHRRATLGKLIVVAVSAATAAAAGVFASGATALAVPVFQFNPGLPLLDAANANTAAAEPSIRVDTEGHVYVDGPAGVPTGGCPFWLVHPDFQEATGHVYKYQGKFDTGQFSAGGGDCDIATGGLPPQNNFDNLAVSSLSLADLTVNQSANGGTTWHGPAANGAGNQTPGDDRQWQAADTGIGENYLTVHDVATDNIQIATSIDGGYTYVSKNPAMSAVPGSCGAALPDSCATVSVMDNHFGNIVINKATHQLYTIWVAPATHAEAVAAATPGGFADEHVVYIASGTPVCAIACAPGVPIASITWTDHVAYAAPTGVDFGHDFPSIAIDAGGAVYATWSDTHHIFMTHSATPDTDGTWSAPTQVDQGASHSNMFPWIVGGKAGAVDAVWYSAQLNGTTGCGSVTNATDGDANGVNNNCHNVWTTQFSQSLNTGSTFSQSTASGVIHNGSICDQGLSCTTPTPIGDRTLLDFFQVDLDPAGAANIAYASDIATPGTAQITYTRQCTGPSASTSASINYNCAAFESAVSGPPLPTCDGAHVATDPAGDAQNPTGAPNPPSGAPGNTEQVDITNVAFSADPANLTTTMSLASLPVPPKPDPITGTTDSYYYVAWTSSDGNTYATQVVEPSSGPLEFSYGKFDPSTNQLTTSNSATGSITIGTPGIISVTVPLSGIGNPTIPVTGGTPAVHDPYAVTISGEGAVGIGLVFTHPDDRAPDSGYGADWSVCGPTGGSVPEAPSTVLIALGGAGAMVIYAVTLGRRRRRGQLPV